MTNQLNVIDLPRPFVSGGLPLAETIAQRRSIRNFTSAPVLLFHLSQILWAAQGITLSSNQARAVPSAGAAYPLEIFAVIGENGIEKTESGIYHYEVENHILSLHMSGDLRSELSSAALGQDAIAVAPVSIVICAVYDRTMIRYNVRGERYVFIEVGHSGQNIYLQATALGLGTVGIGAFRDDEVRKVLQMDSKFRPLYIMPVGKPALSRI
jgi:SagB-type dehydrogenase family enzyme